MKTFQKIFYLVFTLNICINQEILPLTQRYFHTQDMGSDYSRGTYLIVLADVELASILQDKDTGDFIYFKQTQGYDVKVVTIANVGNTPLNLKKYFK